MINLGGRNKLVPIGGDKPFTLDDLVDMMNDVAGTNYKYNKPQRLNSRQRRKNRYK